VNGHYEPDTLDLRDYIAVLRRRKWTIVLTIVGVVAAAMTVTLLQTPEYESSTKLVVTATGAASDESILQELILGERELETQREIVTSVPVAQRAMERLEVSTDPNALLERIRVDAVRDTNILDIRATALEPEDAAALSQAFADSYLEFRREQAMERALSAASDLEGRMATIRERLEEIAAEREDTDDPEEESALDQEQDALLTQLGQLSAQFAALRSEERMTAGGGEVIRPAEVPAGPSSPQPMRNLALALVLGGMLGVGFAFLRDFLDDAIRSDEEAVRATGRPVLGHIPAWSGNGRGDRAVTLMEPASPAAEAFRTLRTNLRFLAVEQPIRSLIVTSAQAGEGKTTVAANLAVAAARSGSRVMLIGADMRKPTIHRLFGISAGRGLSDILSGEVSFADAIRDVGVTNLRVVTSGDIPPNPTELLASGRMQAFIAQASELADLVIYDGPPLLGVADALELAPRMDASLLVVDVGNARRSAVKASAERLAGINAHLAGLTMNRIDVDDSYYGYYYAAYESTVEEPVPPRRRTVTRR
jgi:capsular exopolysaccharide synthesis family protein